MREKREERQYKEEKGGENWKGKKERGENETSFKIAGVLRKVQET